MDTRPPLWARQMLDKLDNFERVLITLANRQTAKEWYSTDEVAEILGKAKFTVREWCRLGRVHCRKKNNGRGKYQNWVISHDEIQRIQREGLLPRETISTIIDHDQ